MQRFGTARRNAQSLALAVLLAAALLVGCSAQVPQAVVQSTTTLPARQAQAPTDSRAAPAAVDTDVVAIRAPVTAGDIGSDVSALPSGDEGPPPVAGSTSAAPPVVEQSVTAGPGEFDIVSAVRAEASESPPYEIENTVPALVHPDSSVAALVNEAIEYLYAGPVELFRSDMEDYFGGLTVADVDISSFTSDFDVTFLSEQLLSLRLTFVNRIGGSDVATVQTIGAVFDLSNGTMVALGDVIRGGGLGALSELVRSEVVRTLYGGDAEAFSLWEASITSSYMGSFTVGPMGLQFGFNQFEIGDDTLGAPIVVIPYQAIVDVIDPASPVGDLLF